MARGGLLLIKAGGNGDYQLLQLHGRARGLHGLMGQVGRLDTSWSAAGTHGGYMVVGDLPRRLS